MTAWRGDRREAITGRIRRAFRDLRLEGSGPGREAAAVGLGVFLGCLPVYGLHLLLCWVTGALFRLNRLKVYLAANISNPFVAPWLLLAELQVGAWLRHGALQSLRPSAVRAAGLDVVLIDLVTGSVVVGLALAAIAASATYFVLRSPVDDTAFLDLVRRASDRYVGASIIAWEFARGKMRGDPIYRAALCGGLLRSGHTLIDLGCGQGLMLSLLAEARRAVATDRWPASLPAPPQFERMIGIELRPRAAAAARQALEGDAEVVEADATGTPFAGVSAVLLFDVLQMVKREDQDLILARLSASLRRDGVILVREADAAAGWRFRAVRLGNRLKAMAFGNWRQRFSFRTRDEWLECFARHQLNAEVHAMGDGTPFANVLFTLTVKADAAGSTTAGARSE